MIALPVFTSGDALRNVRLTRRDCHEVRGAGRSEAAPEGAAIVPATQPPPAPLLEDSSFRRERQTTVVIPAQGRFD